MAYCLEVYGTLYPLDGRPALLGRLFDRVDLIKLVSDVRQYVRKYVRPSVHKKFL